MRMGLVALLVVTCVSCVSSTQWMIRRDGEVRNCSGASAGGLIWASAAVDSVVDDCASGYRLLGFIEAERLPTLGVIVEEGAGRLRIKEVRPGGPAAIAGIQPDVYLVAVDGRPVPDALQGALALMGPEGREVELLMDRGWEDRYTVRVRLGSWPTHETGSLEAP